MSGDYGYGYEWRDLLFQADSQVGIFPYAALIGISPVSFEDIVAAYSFVVKDIESTRGLTYRFFLVSWDHSFRSPGCTRIFADGENRILSIETAADDDMSDVMGSGEIPVQDTSKRRVSRRNIQHQLLCPVSIGDFSGPLASEILRLRCKCISPSPQ